MPQTQEATATTILSVKWEPSNHLTQPLFSQLWGDDDAFVDIDTVTVNLMASAPVGAIPGQSVMGQDRFLLQVHPPWN